MVIDEVSHVDKDANGHAQTLITKRDDPEGHMPPVAEDEQTFSVEDLVYDDEGNAYLPVDLGELGEENQSTPDEPEDENQESPEDDEAEAQKQADLVLAKLSKALGDDERNEAVAGAYGQIAKLQKRAERAELVAKQERDLRLTREYIAKAAEYRLPVPPDVLGPVLKRCSEALSKEDCTVLAQCLEAAEGPAEFDPYAEIGKAGGGDNTDVLTAVDAAAEELFSKGVEAGTGFTREQAIAKVFAENPGAYDEYLRDRRALGR